MGLMRALVFLLMFGLWPGATEAVVDIGHTLLEGHSPHGEVADHADGTGDHESNDGHDEHQCSALFHLCGCHAPLPTAATSRLVLSPTAWAELRQRDPQALTPLLQPADVAVARASRPPIA